MEDFILREIDKIGVLLRGLLARLGLRRAEAETDDDAERSHTVKTELMERLDLELDTLLERADFVEELTGRCGFGESDLELFAELLADLAMSADEPSERHRLAAAACTIYKYQDAHGAPASYNRYHILRALSELNP